MLAAVLAAALAQPASEAATEVEAMRAQMHEYFAGERKEADFWFAAGFPSVVAGAELLGSGKASFQAASVPLLLFGLIQTAAGIFLFARTPGQVRDLDALLTKDPAAYAAQERKRMARVNRGFAWYQPVELAFLAAGAVVAGVANDPRNEVRLALGLALMAESAVMLVFDHFAGERAERYAQQLTAFRY